MLSLRHVPILNLLPPLAFTANVHHICYKLSWMSGQSLCIYYPEKERGSKEVSVCFSIVVKVAFLPLYFWKETYTQLSLNRHLYKADTCCWFLPFFCYFSVSILSEDTRPLKRTTDAFETVNGHLRSVLLSENTSKIHQTVYGKLPFLLFCRLIRPIRRHCTVTLLDL